MAPTHVRTYLLEEVKEQPVRTAAPPRTRIWPPTVYTSLNKTPGRNTQQCELVLLRVGVWFWRVVSKRSGLTLCEANTWHAHKTSYVHGERAALLKEVAPNQLFLILSKGACGVCV